jgi:demethylmenaquinone methyltransferase/2-methoxy-6-polyprenyl-1,4-benzoquinol methylase
MFMKAQVLDLAGGTGDLTALFSKRVGVSGRVVLADINAAMLQTGRNRFNLSWISRKY